MIERGWIARVRAKHFGDCSLIKQGNHWLSQALVVWNIWRNVQMFEWNLHLEVLFHLANHDLRKTLSAKATLDVECYEGKIRVLKLSSHENHGKHYRAINPA